LVQSSPGQDTNLQPPVANPALYHIVHMWHLYQQ